MDANTIWHRRLAEALGEVRPTVAFLPRADLRFRTKSDNDGDGRTEFAYVGLPPGWANRLSIPAAEIMTREISRTAKRLRRPVIILPSPAYAALARRLHGRYPLVYYCADDYSAYRGWLAPMRREASILKRVDLAAFVSEALAERARALCGSVFVSPNATEARFALSNRPEAPSGVAGLARPIVGILGALTRRLDIELVRRVAALPSVGSLLVAGPVDPTIEAEEPFLRSPKIHIAGRLPHEDMHLWAHAMDAALVPYAESDLNWYCSPMRLWDHLATGVPVFALPTCDQIVRLNEPGVYVGPPEALLARISDLRLSRIMRQPQLWHDRAVALVTAIEARLAQTAVPGGATS